MKDGLILILAAIILLMLAIGRDHKGPAAIIQDVSMKVTNADYCAPVKGPPLLRGPRSKVDYRIGNQFNDKGVA